MSTEGPLAHLNEHYELIEADLALMRQIAPAADRVLDVGAGRGSFVLEARRNGLQALALDMQPEAGALWQRLGVPGAVGDGRAIPFRDASFDAVRLKEIIEHVQDPLTLVREAKRVLKPGGIFIAHVPTPHSQLYPVGNFWNDYTHVRPFSRVALHRLIADAGLDMLRIDAYTAGRNSVEQLLGKLLARVFPHIYRVVAKRGLEAESRC